MVNMETVTDVIFLSSKIIADGNYNHEIKRHLLLGRKAMTNLDGLLRSRNIILPTKVRIVKSIVFPVVMYRCENWTAKKAEHWRTKVSELWCWRRLLRVPWTARRSNQSALKEINPEYLLEGMMAEADAKKWLVREDPDAGKDWEQEEKGATEDEMVGWHHWHDGHEFEHTLGNSEEQGRMDMLQSMKSQRVGKKLATEQQQLQQLF